MLLTQTNPFALMKPVGKKYATLLIIPLLLSTLTIGLISAQVLAQPSVPTFTVKFVDYSYREPDRHVKNGYTGETKTYPGDFVSNKSIEVTIRNQPFVSTKLNDGNYTQLWYGVRTKGHFEDWKPNFCQGPRPTQHASDSDYTVLLIPLDSTARGYGIKEGATVDIQVHAYVAHPVIGYNKLVFNMPYTYYEALVTSDWSAIQTITIPHGSTATFEPTTPSPTPTSTAIATSSEPINQQNTETFLGGGLSVEQLAITVLFAFVVVLALALIYSLKKRVRPDTLPRV